MSMGQLTIHSKIEKVSRVLAGISTHFLFCEGRLQPAALSFGNSLCPSYLFQLSRFERIEFFSISQAVFSLISLIFFHSKKESEDGLEPPTKRNHLYSICPSFAIVLVHRTELLDVIASGTLPYLRLKPLATVSPYSAN